VLAVRVAQHHQRVADPNLGVADAVARCGEPLHLLGAEHLLEEVDQPGRSVHDQIRRDGMIAVGLGLDRHGFSPLFG
jgi:hypothetical protein